jgi:hypothetical protein
VEKRKSEKALIGLTQTRVPLGDLERREIWRKEDRVSPLPQRGVYIPPGGSGRALPWIVKEECPVGDSFILDNLARTKASQRKQLSLPFLGQHCLGIGLQLLRS